MLVANLPPVSRFFTMLFNEKYEIRTAKYRAQSLEQNTDSLCSRQLCSIYTNQVHTGGVLLYTRLSKVVLQSVELPFTCQKLLFSRCVWVTLDNLILVLYLAPARAM